MVLKKMRFREILVLIKEFLQLLDLDECSHVSKKVLGVSLSIFKLVVFKVHK